MGRKGKTGRLKRKPAPKFWQIHRKEYPWVRKPSSGPHNLQNCLPMALVLREMLGYAETRREAQILLNQGKVLVDGKAMRKDDFPVGLMDIISIPDADHYYRIMPSHKGLILSPINKEETNYKLARIEDKMTIPGGIQLNLSDGSNILIKTVNPKDPKEDIYETFDVLKVSLPGKEIVGCIQLKEGSFAAITGGKNIGVIGKIVEVEKTEGKKRKNALVVVEDDQGNRFQTVLDFIFSLGDKKPESKPESKPVEPAVEEATAVV